MASRNGNNVSSGGLSRVVCVTGAGGFIGTWLVKELLLRGYHVNGTVRNPESNAHLKELEGAAERLTLYKADIRDHENILQAVVSLAIEGTRNIINAAADVGARRVVLTSSIGAIHMNPKRSPDTVVDENCWSDIDYCEKTKNYYSMSKTIEEMAAIVEAKARG
uniref:NAD(P)-binding domain-containing protein n=1 Tax=Ananas comosus var. bracteatus TaxID=296719 RepID=A0A6V7NQQ1_ANACO|nr:unnamed protein product [Ananas comosus var. bracteatus]